MLFELVFADTFTLLVPMPTNLSAAYRAVCHRIRQPPRPDMCARTEAAFATALNIIASRELDTIAVSLLNTLLIFSLLASFDNLRRNVIRSIFAVPSRTTANDCLDTVSINAFCMLFCGDLRGCFKRGLAIGIPRRADGIHQPPCAGRRTRTHTTRCRTVRGRRGGCFGSGSRK